MNCSSCLVRRASCHQSRRSSANSTTGRGPTLAWGTTSHCHSFTLTPPQDKTASFAQKWIRQHIADAAALGEPLLLEEFGKWGSGAQRAERDQYMKLVYDEIAAVSA